jgi:glycine/D-amino acid oxidase-like deaminating enzyme
MSDATIFDAIVIGGGIIGCNIANALSARKQRVALLEASEIGSGTSANSFAWINATSKLNSEEYHRLNALGLHTYLALARQWGEKRIGLHLGGTLEWASDADPAALESLRAKAGKLKAWDYPIAWVTTSELRALEPHVQFADTAQGLYALADPWLDVPVFLDFLKSRMIETGAAVFEHTAARELIIDDDGKVLGVKTSNGTLTANQVVLATGPSTPDVLAELTGYEGYSARFPMTRSPGLLVTTPAEEHRQLAQHVLYDYDAGVHLRPGGSGGLVIGADETDGLVEEDSDLETQRKAAHRLLEKTQAMLPDFEGPSVLDRCSLRIGIRAVPADGDSIAGPLPSSEGLFVVCTHSGVTMGPAIGNLTADAVITGQLPKQFAPFGLERFQM